MEQFEYTTDGYSKAKKWLEEIEEWDRISNHGFSTDGWSIVQSANILWKNKNGN